MEAKDHLEFPKEVIGNRIRQYRKELGLTVEQLGQKTGISQSMISQIERGQVNPSLDTLWKLSYHLEVPVFYFFKNINRNSVNITRKEEQRIVTMLHPNVTYRLLSSTRDRKIEMMELIVEPGEVSHLPSLSHKGEECGYIIKGELEVIIDEERHHLKTGDSIYFDSTLPHKFYNPGTEQAIGIWAMTPPNKR